MYQTSALGDLSHSMGRVLLVCCCTGSVWSKVHIDDPDTKEPLSLGLFHSEREAGQVYDCAMIVLQARMV